MRSVILRELPKLKRLKPPNRSINRTAAVETAIRDVAVRFAGSSPAGFSGWQSKGGQGRPVYRCLRLEGVPPIRTPGKM
jgi:hypothetical protein